MGPPFIIRINFSKILKDNDETLYTMLIDDSKMTIVYELIEWIRWIFSLKQCFFLTHKDSVIHDLEDIRLLSLLKNFEARVCSQTNCIHKQIYITLLDELDLFVHWQKLKVPKLFFQKINNMNKKLGKTNFLIGNEELEKEESNNILNKDNQNIPEKCNNNDPFLEESSSEDLKFRKKQQSNDIEELVSEKEESHKECFEMNLHNVNKINCKGKIRTYEKIKPSVNFSDLNLKTDKPEDVINVGNTNLDKISKDSLVQLSSTPLVNKNTDVDEYLNKTEKIIERGNEKPVTKRARNKYVKPFSIGEFLEKARFELENTNEKEKVSGKLQQTTFSNFDNDFSEPKEKKRKRIRKHRSKRRRVSLDNGDVTKVVENLNTSGKTYGVPYCKNKPNHKRFDSDDDGNLACNEIEETTVLAYDNLGIDSNIEENKHADLLKGVSAEVITVINDKNQILPHSPILSDSRIKNLNGMECPPTNNKSENLDNVSTFASQDFEQQILVKPNQANFNKYNHNSIAYDSMDSLKFENIEFLKEKFSHPVVFERFG